MEPASGGGFGAGSEADRALVELRSVSIRASVSMYRYLRWRAKKASRRLMRAACRHLYRDSDGDLRRSIIVAGAGRSGTTWLADIIGSQLSCRMMFEPFHSRQVEEFGSFHYFQYMRPNEANERLLDFSRKVLTGRIRHRWIDRHVEVLLPQFRLIKEIRACLFLRWLHDQFPEVPILFIVRHPCAVVASRLQLEWATDGDIEPFLSQPELVDDHLREHLPLIRKASTDEEKHAIIWCVSNLVPLRQFVDARLNVVFYEELCRRPNREISRVFRVLGRRSGKRASRSASRVSTTARGFSAVVTGQDPVTRWRKVLTEDQIARILEVVDRFGLGHLYGLEEPKPGALDGPGGVSREGAVDV